MEASELKVRIIEEDKILVLLEELGMHSIDINSKYVSCGMPDGDNPKSTIVYLDNLSVEAYTRDIHDSYGHSDIVSLVSFIKELYFARSIKWICEVCGFDFYEDKKEASAFKKWILDMHKKSQDTEDDEGKVKPIHESILTYYKPLVNKKFYDDGISYETQRDFEVGFDLDSMMITIPIRDELGTLVGVKGRRFDHKYDHTGDKYIYLEPCAKTKILYGLYKTLPYIKKKKEVIVVESEKGVQQLWSMGIRNAVAVGSHKLSKTQVNKLTHLNVAIVIAYDQGVELDKQGEINKKLYPTEFNKFLETQEVYCIYDKTGKILDEKESPSDNPDKWNELYLNYKMKVRG